MRAACRDTASGSAGIGAIEVEADAGRKVLNVILAETGVGTGGAGLCTIEAGLDAFGEYVLRTGGGIGMSAHHILDVHGGPRVREGIDGFGGGE